MGVFNYLDWICPDCHTNNEEQFPGDMTQINIDNLPGLTWDGTRLECRKCKGVFYISVQLKYVGRIVRDRRL